MIDYSSFLVRRDAPYESYIPLHDEGNVEDAQPITAIIF